MTKSRTRNFVFGAILFTMIAPLPASARPSSPSTETMQTAQALTSVATIARNLSNKAQDVFNIASSQRRQIPVELYVALCGFAGSAGAYAQMAADAREEAGLRSAAQRLVAQTREIDALFSTLGAANLQQSWRLVQEQVALLSNTYPLVYTYPISFRDSMMRTGRATTLPAPVAGGRFRWRGRVDGSDYIMVQGNQVSISHLEDRFIQDASYELPVPLPQQTVNLKLTKLKGRGNVEIVRQPTPENRYTLTVLIEDLSGGDDFYEFEVVW